LPVTLYQIQTKFRDEIRTRFGIVRACEFIMKDAYSFDKDVDGLTKNYDRMYEAYQRIFKRLELDVVIIKADSGAMGGDISHEFMVPAPIGEDFLIFCSSCGFSGAVSSDCDEGSTCPECKKTKLKKQIAIELGHIFQLGIKYSQSLKATFVDEDGKIKPMIMGCYGIGVSRVIAAIIEKHNDEKGIIWPKEVAPFDIEIIPLVGKDDAQEILTLADKYHQDLESLGFEVLVDDREETVGRKLNDADLIGIPLRIVIGKRNLSEGKVEIKTRGSSESELVDKDSVIKEIKGK